MGQHQDVGGATGLYHDILNIALAETVNVRARRSCGKVIVPWLRFPGRGSPNSTSDKVFAQDTGPLFRAFPEDADRIASNQLLLNFGHIRSPADPNTKLEITRHRRQKDPPQRIGDRDWDVLPSGVLRLIDARRASPNACYGDSRTERPRRPRCSVGVVIRRPIVRSPAYWSVVGPSSAGLVNRAEVFGSRSSRKTLGLRPNFLFSLGFSTTIRFISDSLNPIN